MTSKNDPAAAAARKHRFTLERTYPLATVQDVWELWTTQAGIESWWGPEGFQVKVHEIDLRPGGLLRYAMIATGAEQIDFMKKSGMPLTMESRLTYVEITPPRRLAYTHLADFIPGVEPYDVAISVDLYESGDGVRLVLTSDAMHEEQWTQMAVMGWQSELGKLGEALQARVR